jgi:hypothetical protein
LVFKPGVPNLRSLSVRSLARALHRESVARHRSIVPEDRRAANHGAARPERSDIRRRSPSSPASPRGWPRRESASAVRPREIDPHFAHGVDHDRMHAIARTRPGRHGTRASRIGERVEERRGHLRTTALWTQANTHPFSVHGCPPGSSCLNSPSEARCDRLCARRLGPSRASA